MDINRLEEEINLGEAVNREFKSDLKREFTDKEIYEEIVGMANAEGGILFIGVEDDGTITGSRPRHGTTTDPNRLKSAIFHNTRPTINTRISLIRHDKGQVIAIEVDPYPEICAVATGKSLHRIIGTDGKPATVPFYPQDQRSRRIDLGLLDFSAQVLLDTSFEDFNPLEFTKLRQTIQNRHGDHSLLELSDTDLVKALRLVETLEGNLVPNVAGILLLGTDEVIRKFIPTHLFHFQVIDKAGRVRVNDDLVSPLIRLIEEAESRFLARLDEDEIMVGMYRMPIPAYHRDAFREAVNNALLHRDYSRMGAVFLQWYDDHLLITNPGGFPVGITPDNILVHEPRPRNERLAEAFKRIGLIDKTGRGVDTIYLGQLWYGRPVPDYSRSDDTAVRLVLSSPQASRDYVKFIFEAEREGHPFVLDDLIIITALSRQRDLDVEAAAHLIQKNQFAAGQVLEHLVERGILVVLGDPQPLRYSLKGEIFRTLFGLDLYIRIHGSDPSVQEHIILEYVRAHGQVSRDELAKTMSITRDQSRRIIERMVRSGVLEPVKKSPRRVMYVLADRE